MNPVIKPTVGRVVWYFPGPTDQMYDPSYVEPRSASIARVWDDNLVNLRVDDQHGTPVSRMKVPLFQEVAKDNPPKASYCTWMPYQKETAAKIAELEERSKKEADDGS
jgi:hypothetical protein